jgi:hypothetical protein
LLDRLGLFGIRAHLRIHDVEPDMVLEDGGSIPFT